MRASAARSFGTYTLDRRPLEIPAYRRLQTASAVCAVGGLLTAATVAMIIRAVPQLWHHTAPKADRR
ncbi:hypothetical protein [Streptosporangium lutulentum]|uniref:Uncharacterized protein n=1 Tax=Streptosporangium lutulentum TaxID=1461250 RepID=A0ABT9QB70_9ACTN|nr:hypothetical protein [Streptosporangium lutulentum]MDP9844017.1 hypothetical protein [Streptosporangium lutulentum]